MTLELQDSLTKVEPAPQPKFSIPLTIKWRQGRERLSFRKASTFWTFGKRFSGKSSVLEMVAIKYLNEGATIFDIFSARDSESLAWLRSPYKDVLLVVGNSTRLKTKWNWIKMGDFNLREAESHEVIITTPRFYISPYEMYAAISQLTDVLQWRTTWDHIDVLMVREAFRLLASRIVSGKAKNRLEAETEFVELHNEAYHTGLATLIDSIRPIAILPDVREIANYVFIKRIGRMKLPKDMEYVLRRIKPAYLRRMPIDQAVILTDNNNIGIGKFPKIPWHVERGENLLRNLGIEIVRESDAKAQAEETQKDARQNISLSMNPRKKISTLELHQQILALRSEGKDYRTIIGKLPVKISAATVSRELGAHYDKTCICSPVK